MLDKYFYEDSEAYLIWRLKELSIDENDFQGNTIPRNLYERFGLSVNRIARHLPTDKQILVSIHEMREKIDH